MFKLYFPSILTDPIKLTATEGSEYTIHFHDEAPKGEKYKALGWLKGNADKKSEMTVYNEYENHKEPIYFDSYCNCTASQRISLNKTNGDLTILNVSLNDQGDYFYWFWSESGFPNTGKNYQINLQVDGELLFYRYNHLNIQWFQEWEIKYQVLVTKSGLKMI